MQIKLNDRNEIVSFAVIGGVIGGIEVEVPENVSADNLLSYRYENGSFVKNVEWLPPEEPLSEIEQLQLAVAELAEIIAGGEA